MSLRRALPLVLVLGFLACAQEAGRVRLGSEGSGAATLELKAGDVDFWTDIDVAYEGDATLKYRIELFQDGTKVDTAECDPLGRLPTKTSWVETNLGGSHSRRGAGRMTCSAKLAKGGPTIVKTDLAFGKRPEKLTMKKADLVIKQ